MCTCTAILNLHWRLVAGCKIDTSIQSVQISEETVTMCTVDAAVA